MFNVTHILTCTILANLQISYITTISIFSQIVYVYQLHMYHMWELMSAIAMFKLPIYTMLITAVNATELPLEVSWYGFIARSLSQLAGHIFTCDGLCTLHK